MKRAFFLISLFLLFFITSNLHSEPPFEFRKISENDLDIEYYKEKFPGKPAVIIGDIADSHFNYDYNAGGFHFVFNRKKRLIILDESGLDYGNIIIPFYGAGRSEDIRGFRANVYNEKDGWLRNYERSSARERHGYVRDIGNNWKELRVPLPDVKVGSVIEYKYQIVSSSFRNLRHWQLQYEIPKMHSEYSVSIPNFYIYRQRMQGIEGVEIIESVENKEDLIRIPQGYVALNTTKYSWKAKDIPALTSEPYTDNIFNYAGRLFFELVRVEMPNNPFVHFTSTWEHAVDHIIKRYSFGGYIDNCEEFTKQFVKDKDFDSTEDKLWWAINKINDKVRWNAASTYLAYNYPETVWERGSGNSAEINLLLVALLRNLNLDAYPVVLSTVDGGMLFTSSPTITQWNYVVAMVIDEDSNEILMDATEPVPVPGYLPFRAINERGRSVDEDVNKWVDLENNILINEKRIYDLKLNSNGDLTGSLRYEYSDFGKYFIMQVIENHGKEALVDIIKEDKDLDIKNENFEWDAENDLPLVFTADVSVNSFAQRIGDELILPALLFDTDTDMIFDNPERKFPVVFNNTLNSNVVYNVMLDDNLKVSYLPENSSHRWTRFSNEIVFENNDNGFTVNDTSVRNTRTVSAEHYENLRKFYKNVAESNSDNILLKIN